MLERAAALANTTVSAFVVNTALDAASRLIRERQQIVLGERDWDIFFNALVNPPKSNAALRKAFAAHKQLISQTANE